MVKEILKFSIRYITKINQPNSPSQKTAQIFIRPIIFYDWCVDGNLKIFLPTKGELIEILFPQPIQSNSTQS